VSSKRKNRKRPFETQGGIRKPGITKGVGLVRGGKVKTRALKLQGYGTRQNFYDLECERRAGKALEIERQVQPVGAE
jgi:hypothetical protein